MQNMKGICVEKLKTKKEAKKNRKASYDIKNLETLNTYALMYLNFNEPQTMATAESPKKKNKKNEKQTKKKKEKECPQNKDLLPQHKF